MSLSAMHLFRLYIDDFHDVISIDFGSYFKMAGIIILINRRSCHRSGSTGNVASSPSLDGLGCIDIDIYRPVCTLTHVI